MKYDYDAIVIGGGSAGLTAAGIAASVGAKTAMIESGKLGGDCTWYGCIPSKALIHIASLAHKTSEAEKFGAKIEQSISFSQAMEYVRSTVKRVYEEADDPQNFIDMGIDVLFGKAVFKDDHTVEVNGHGQITGRYIFISAGSRAFVPPIPGLDKIDYLTNHNLFDLTEQPEHLIVIGAGPIGIEMSQSFYRLGSKVTVLDMADSILLNDDVELAGYLLDYLKEEGIVFELGKGVEKVEENNGIISVTLSDGTIVNGDKLLIATGRTPNSDRLQLENTSVEFDRSGIKVNNSGRTNVKHIYAMGDIATKYKFTHMAEHMAKIGVTRALMKIPMSFDTAHITWATYTDPEIAHVGKTEKELIESGINFETYRFPYTKVDRALADDETKGWIKIFAKKWNGKILGATVLGKHAGELISEYAVAMKNGVTLRKLADTIHPYPSYGLGARRAADQWYIKSQSLGLVKLLQFLFRYKGPLPDLSDPNRIV